MTQKEFDRLHIKNLNRYNDDIRKAYLAVINAVAKLGVNARLNDNLEFYFRNNPALSKKVDDLLKKLRADVYGTTVFGIQTEWDLAVDKSNSLAYILFGKQTLAKVPASVRNKLLSGNAGARRAFLTRKEGGLSLSERIWKNTRQFKQELELALELGIGKGKSAGELSRSIRQYLNAPNNLFRRVRNNNGELRLSKAAKIYKPGRGVSRSSYKNAVRLARNEINFSYEASQKEKRDQQDFVVGIEIRVSPSHNPMDDKGGISCLSLQGQYPKTFDFTYKWHVNCKCQSYNIVKTPEEIEEDVDKILSGRKPDTPSKNTVRKLPIGYKKIVQENKQKWADLKNPPRTFDRNK